MWNMIFISLVVAAAPGVDLQTLDGQGVQGKLIALDSPSALIDQLKQDKRLIFSFTNGKTRIKLDHVMGVSRVDIDGENVIVHGSGERFISGVAAALEDQKIAFRDLRTEQPTLEDVFLALTGKEIRN